MNPSVTNYRAAGSLGTAKNHQGNSKNREWNAGNSEIESSQGDHSKISSLAAGQDEQQVLEFQDNSELQGSPRGASNRSSPGLGMRFSGKEQTASWIWKCENRAGEAKQSNPHVFALLLCLWHFWETALRRNPQQRGKFKAQKAVARERFLLQPQHN